VNPPETEAERGTSWPPPTVAVVAAVVVVVSALSGLAFGAGSRVGAVVPIVVVAAAGLLALAMSRFELFVATILLVRASLDAAKVSGSSVDATGAISLLFIVAGILWLVAQREHSRVEPSPFVPALVMLVVVSALGITSTGAPVPTAIEVMRLATVPVIFAVLNRLLVDGRWIGLILGAVFASSVVPVAVGLFQIATRRVSYFPGGFERVDSTFTHPNPFAAYLTMLIILGAALFRYVPARYRPLALALLGSYAALLIGTYARGAWIATAVGLAIVGLLDNRRLLAALLVGAVVLSLAVPSIRGRFEDLSQPVRLTGGPGNSLAWRVGYWRQVLALQDDPLLGIGLGGVEASTEAAKLPHNDLIRMYVETGLAGLLAYLWLILALLRQSARAVARSPDGAARGIATAFAGATAAFLLLSLVGNLISQLVILWYFAAIAAAGVAASRRALDRGVEEDLIGK
jgi:putative inorganic carbon (HCO3(-)) transporter